MRKDTKRAAACPWMNKRRGRPYGGTHRRSRWTNSRRRGANRWHGWANSWGNRWDTRHRWANM